MANLQALFAKRNQPSEQPNPNRVEKTPDVSQAQDVDQAVVRESTKPGVGVSEGDKPRSVAYGGSLASRFKPAHKAPAPEAVPAKTPVADVPSRDAGDDFDIGQLADSLLGSEESVSTRASRSQFADEVPCPKRGNLPDDLPENERQLTKQFIDLIDGVYSMLNDPELLGGVIRSIMIELKAHPQYMKLVAPDDVRVWVKSMRDSMGLARIKKQEAKAKRSGGGAKAKKTPAAKAEMEQAFADLGIDFDNL